MKMCGLNFGLLKLAFKFMRENAFAIIARKSALAVIARICVANSKRFKRSGFFATRKNELRVRQHEVKSTSLKFAQNAALAVIARICVANSKQSTKFNPKNLKNFILNFTQNAATAANQTLILNSPQKRAQNG